MFSVDVVPSTVTSLSGAADSTAAVLSAAVLSVFVLSAAGAVEAAGAALPPHAARPDTITAESANANHFLFICPSINNSRLVF
jgi:hypothetical protein